MCAVIGVCLQICTNKTVSLRMIDRRQQPLSRSRLFHTWEQWRGERVSMTPGHRNRNRFGRVGSKGVRTNQ